MFKNDMLTADECLHAAILDLSPERGMKIMKNSFIGLAAICILIPATLIAQPAEKKTMAGVWEVKESPVGQSRTLLSLAMFGAGGM